MSSQVRKPRVMILTIFLLAVAVTLPGQAKAHCDTLDGPVVADARTALDQNDITPILKWVSAEDEKDIRAAYNQTQVVRKQIPEAKALADMYFFETLVRIHRAGEGAPYTGLKPGEAIDPAVALADQALASGSVDKLVEVLTDAMTQGARDRFSQAYEKQKHAKENVAAGREFVESYVGFTHYVEGLHGLIKSEAAHHGGDTH